MRICTIRKMFMIMAMLLCIAMIGMSTWGAEADPEESLRLLLYKGSVEKLNEEGESISKLVKEEDADSTSNEEEESEPIIEEIVLGNGDSLLTGKDSLASVELKELRILTLGSETSIGYIAEAEDDIQDTPSEGDSQESPSEGDSQDTPSEDEAEDSMIFAFKDGSILLDIQENPEQDAKDQGDADEDEVTQSPEETDPYKPVEIRTSNATVTIPPVESENEGGGSRGNQSENAGGESRSNEAADDAEGDSRTNETADDAEGDSRTNEAADDADAGGDSRNNESEEDAEGDSRTNEAADDADAGGDSQGRRSQDAVEETPGTFISMTQLKLGDERLKDLSENTQARIKALLEEITAPSEDPADKNVTVDEDWDVTILVVLRGSAGITWTDEKDEEQNLSVPAGREVIIIGNEEDGLLADPVTTIIKEEDLSTFITDTLSDEQKEEVKALLEKVNEEADEERSNNGSSRSGNRSGSNNSGNSNGGSQRSGGNNGNSNGGSSSGDRNRSGDNNSSNRDRNRDRQDEQKDTEITTEVYFIAASGSKTYDGTALTAADVTVSGLPEGYYYIATATGSQTAAGSSANVVNSYAIYDANGEDKTALFTNVKMAEGTLTVTPAAVIITTGSAAKEYDGTPLTAAAGIEGLASGESVTLAATGTITDIGSTTNTYSISWDHADQSNYVVTESLGTLQVTANTTSITLTAASGSKTYDGTPLTAADVTVNGMPQGFTLAATAAGSQTDAGSGANVVNSYAIYDAKGNDKTACFSNVTKTDGTLTVMPAAVTITTGSDSKVYDGTPLTATAGIEGLASGESVTITTGSITDAGTMVNNYSITWDNAKESNYTVTESLGTLQVTPAAVTITTGSATKEFDGTPLTAEAGIEGLVPGESVTLSATGAITETGSTENSYSIVWDNAKESNYTITEALGTLEVTANTTPITLTAGSGSKAYDGTPLTAEVTATGLPEGFTLVATADSLTDAGLITNTVTAYSIYDAQGNDRTACFSNIAKVDGALEVTPIAVTITTDSAAKEFDGTPLTAAAGIEGLVPGESVTLYATGTITDLGTATNTYFISWDNANENNYTVTESLGTLEITFNTDLITLTAGTNSKPYDGTPLTAEVTASGLPEGFILVATASGSQTEVGYCENVVTGYQFYDPAGNDRTACFSNVTTEDGLLTVTSLPITFDLGLNYKTFTYIGFPVYTGSIAGYYPNGVNIGQGVYEHTIEEEEIIGAEEPVKEYIYTLTWTFNLIGGETVTLSFERTNVTGTYEVIPEVSVTGNADHYSFAFTNNFITQEYGGVIIWDKDLNYLIYYNSEGKSEKYTFTDFVAIQSIYNKLIANEDSDPLPAFITYLKSAGLIS